MATRSQFQVYFVSVWSGLKASKERDTYWKKGWLFILKKDGARKETYLKRYYILHEQEKHSRKNKEGKTERTKKFYIKY